jgi:hypothetical protein
MKLQTRKQVTLRKLDDQVHQLSTLIKSSQPIPSNLTSPAPSHADIIDPPGTQRHGLLWLSLGIYLGLCTLSLIVKVSGIRRQQKQASRQVQFDDELQSALIRLEDISTERESERAGLEGIVRDLRNEVEVLGPFKDVAAQQKGIIRGLQLSTSAATATLRTRIQHHNERISAIECDMRGKDETIRILREETHRLENFERLSLGKDGRIAELETVDTERVQTIEELQTEVTRLRNLSRQNDVTVREQQTRITNLATEREQTQAQLDIVQEEVLRLMEENDI